ncbi:MAG TPA: lipopolysaccharide assembly protein LapA domain-containing protein [Sphingomicrobium sp.]|nr:lipopolysaccharide assembly protein LapA domain-containing protein [Sphingomicrobium sp.]
MLSTSVPSPCDEPTQSCDEPAYDYERAGAAQAPQEPDWMHFLKTLFWVLVAVIVTFFAYRNWAPVTLNLWGDIQVDIKIPLLLLLIFLLGFLPTWLIMRARLWTYRRRVDALERTRASTVAAAPEPAEGDPAE